MEALIVQFLMNLVNTIGWFGVVVVMILESCNIPIPSEVTMPLAGWALVQAKSLPAWQAAVLGGLLGGLACTIGSVISYGLGAWGGRPLVERYGRYILVSGEDLERADRWFARWGDWAAFISRLLPIVRTFISLPAGIVRMNFPRFVLLTFTGSFIWCGLLALGGYHLGANWEQLANVIRPFEIPIGIAIVALLAYYVYRHIRRGTKRSTASTSEGEE